MHTNCGIYGIISRKNNFVINETLNSLKKMQHRGQESFGISYIENQSIKVSKYEGLVKDIIISNPNIVKSIGHVRYSTSGKTNDFSEIQPLYGKHPILGEFSLAHNGNIPFIENSFNKFNFDCQNIVTDSHLILKFIENSPDDNWLNIMINILNIFKRAFCIIILTNDNIYALKDTYGVRPLSIGKNDFSVGFSSESRGFINLNFYKEINGGEIYSIDNNLQIELMYKSKNNIQSICSFEQIYFMKEDSIINGQLVKSRRELLGKSLAKNDNFSSEYIVSGIPNSGNSYAISYAQELNLNYYQFIDKKENLGRTFILQTDQLRNLACTKKYIYNQEIIKDNKLILVDDSLVRGTTIKNIIKIIKELGAKEVHIRVGSPIVKGICYYGIDIPSKEELIGNLKDVDQICSEIGADSLKYVSTNEMIHILGNGHCTGCFNQDYKDKLEW